MFKIFSAPFALRTTVALFVASVTYQQALADCDYSGLTADPTDPYFLCSANCGAQIPANMGCHALGIVNVFCPEYCSQAKDDDCESKAGNPINLSNGTKYQHESDYVGQGSHPLEIHRYYESSRGNIDGNFGFNWAGISSSHIEVRKPTISTDQFNVKKQDGSIEAFSWAGLVNNVGTTAPYKTTTTDKLTMIKDETGNWGAIVKSGV